MIPPPHPRDSLDLQGAEPQERAFLAAMQRGRVHHAWLLVGPEGVGKASFAFRAARRLLGAAADPSHGVLGAPPDDPVLRQVAVGSHPDLTVLERLVDDAGKAKRDITVDQARKLPDVFAGTAGQGGWRVAIIDSVDDMNPNAANSILKTLEEPPSRGVLFLISHQPGRLLPTIRSRCRQLRFAAWPQAECAAFIAERAGLAEGEAERLAAVADGAPGRAWRLAGEGALEADRAALALLRSLPQVDGSALLGLADGFRGAAGQGRFRLLLERLAERVREMATSPEQAVGGGLDRWAAVWELLARLPDEAEAVNLDRADAFWSVVARLRAAAATT